MGQHVLLNDVEHHDLRFITRRGAPFGDSVNQVLIYPYEFEQVQRHYPIFFRQTKTSGFKSVAVLGFEKNENLFLDGDRWQAHYIPDILNVGPFLIGQPEAAPGEILPANAEAMILVDIDHPRISREEGELLFRAHGGNSATLVQITKALQQLDLGARVNDAMFEAFYEAGLVAPVVIEVRLSAHSAFILNDMFTISREAMHRLSGPQLRLLIERGFLALAFHVVSSMANLASMIEMKTAREAGAAASHTLQQPIELVQGRKS